jgi:multimeric flavodoxin WrbA
MKLMAIIGSPRKSSNTEILVDQVIAGCRSKTTVAVEKITVVQKDIKYCTGCMTCCFPPPGTGTCIIKDDMAAIIEIMKASDAFIFGTPNHMGTITAPLLNFLSRMMPLFDFKIIYDDQGNMMGGELSSKIRDKKVAMVISQGDPFFSSSLVYMVLEKNFHDFKLTKVSDVLSRSNLEEKSVMKKEEDLKKAFDLGVLLATGFGIK